MASANENILPVGQSAERDPAWPTHLRESSANVSRVILPLSCEHEGSLTGQETLDDPN